MGEKNTGHSTASGSNSVNTSNIDFICIISRYSFTIRFINTKILILEVFECYKVLTASSLYREREKVRVTASRALCHGSLKSYWIFVVFR